MKLQVGNRAGKLMHILLLIVSHVQEISSVLSFPYSQIQEFSCYHNYDINISFFIIHI